MLFLQPHHIIAVYVLVDELVPKPVTNSQGGRPPILSTAELLTILIWITIVAKPKCLKDLYQHMNMYYRDYFHYRPTYAGFVAACHRNYPVMLAALRKLLNTKAKLRFVDSTFLEVCKLVRADRHKIAKTIAHFGKNHQGWHYGFKLHVAIDHKKKLSGVVITPANNHDAQMLPRILNEHTSIAVGDTAYTASVMQQYVFKRFGTVIISPPHPRQTKKLMTQWQHQLLMKRPMIETVFDYLKEHMHLVSSFPRSIKGYFVHYLRILLTYQFLMVFGPDS